VRLKDSAQAGEIKNKITLLKDELTKLQDTLAAAKQETTNV